MLIKAKRARKTYDFVMTGNAEMKFSACPGQCTCQWELRVAIYTAEYQN